MKQNESKRNNLKIAPVRESSRRSGSDSLSRDSLVGFEWEAGAENSRVGGESERIGDLTRPFSPGGC